MYRPLLIILYTALASSAPADDNSEITYVKIQPVKKEETPIQPRATAFRESRIENLPLVIPGVNPEKYSRHIRSDDIDTTTFSYPETETTAEPVTAIETTETSFVPVPIETRPKSPKYYSKLSYFQKTNDLDDSISTNLIERYSKRRFRSKCRCEKIWNCPKLQISVSRCPDEYFLCCF